MLWNIALWFSVIAVEALCLVKPEQVLSDGNLSCQNPKVGLFENISVTSFTDENRYIRLNISWGKPKENPIFHTRAETKESFDTFSTCVESIVNFSIFEMMIDTNCSALYGDRTISVDQNYVIQPNMERLKHPAEPLVHGCKYEFEFFTEISSGNRTCMVRQEKNYEIPECVEEVCECGMASSPYELQDYVFVVDHIYTIRFNKTDSIMDLNLEEVFDKVWYTNFNSNKTVSLVQIGQISFDNANNAITLPFHDFHDGSSYIVYIDLLLDSCEYRYSTRIDVPKASILQSATRQYPMYLIVLSVSCIVLTLVLLKTKPQLLQKLKKYLPFVPDTLPVTYTPEASAVISRTTKEVINSQYTPLEFIVNSYKYDQFECPRNRIILKNEIGGGAFGKVFKAEVYGLDNKSGCILAAAKKPIENAPSEEIADFLAEIETMKKVASYGGHPNVIKIWACVTIDSPHIMVMELVPCGSLKSYLSKLRKEWEERKSKLQVQKNDRHFFPDNMIVENFIPAASASQICEKDKLKYSDLAFEDYTGSIHSSETNSYITPDTPNTPSMSDGSPVLFPSPARRLSDRKMLQPPKSRRINKMVPTCFAPQSPITPNSISSCGLPSGTETLLTPLDSAPVTPLMELTQENTNKVKPVLDSKELQNFALQIANGMSFLENIDITHRDLAARNILVSENKVLKISDFGMARVGVYVNTAQKRQPLRWMAPEAIESRRCDNKTDVWSFGVVLWEIGSLGAFPYKELSNELVIAHILQGKRLKRPETCTDQVYELMERCWQKNPDDRPRFEDIARQLDANNAKIYVDFNKISPKYVFPPTQEENT